MGVGNVHLVEQGASRAGSDPKQASSFFAMGMRAIDQARPRKLLCQPKPAYPTMNTGSKRKRGLLCFYFEALETYNNKRLNG
jgi:hypothetical protein